MIHHVVVQIRHQSPGDFGQITEGFYVIQGDQLIMTHSDGFPVDDQFRHTLKAGDNPNAIARILTREVRRYMLGITKAEEEFGRPLNYGNAGLA